MLFAANNNLNQYTRYQGYPPLAQNISRLFSPKYLSLNRPIDPLKEIIVAEGSTSVISGIIWPFFKKGDGILVFDNVSPKRKFMFAQRGLNVKTVRTKEDGSFDLEQLKSEIDSNTRAVYLDNPSISVGEEIKADLLTGLADIVKSHEDLYVISDESHSCNLSNPQGHVSFGSLEGMWQRTFSVFGTTGLLGTPGLKVGWLIADENHVKDLATFMSYNFFSTSTTG